MGKVKFKKSVSFGERSWKPGDIAEIEDGLEKKILKADPNAIERIEKLGEPELKIGETLEIGESKDFMEGENG